MQLHHPVSHNLRAAAAAAGQTERGSGKLKSYFVRADAWRGNNAGQQCCFLSVPYLALHSEGEMSDNLLAFTERSYITLFGKCRKQRYFRLPVHILYFLKSF